MAIYAGVGSRETPDNILKIMTKCAILLAHDGYICSTGAAVGADQAFAEGSNLSKGTTHLHLPWKTYEKEWVSSLQGDNIFYILNKGDIEAYNSVEMFHPAYDNFCNKPGTVALHARNYNILKKPTQVQFIICWTKNGDYIGGTAQAMRIADHFKIPIYNLGKPNILLAFIKKIEQRENEINSYDVD